MVAAKKLAVVAVMLCLALGVILGCSAASLVHAEEVDESTASSVQVEAAPDSTPEAAASSLPQAVQALTGNIEDYLVPLLGEEARPAVGYRARYCCTTARLLA